MTNRFIVERLILSITLIASVCFFFINVNAAGKIDSTFGTNASATIDVGNSTTITDIAIQADDKIVVAGFFNPTQDNFDIFFTRFNADGSLDTSFGFKGTSIFSNSESEFITSIEIHSDGKIFAVGRIKTEQSPNSFLLMKLNQNGSLDGSFGTSGIVIVNQSPSDHFSKVAIQPNGKIVAVGGVVKSGLKIAALRFNANGSLNSDFGNGGLVIQSLPNQAVTHFYSTLEDVEILPDGRILVGGTYNVPRPGEDEIGYYIQILNEDDGSIDKSFGNQGLERRGISATIGYNRGTFDAEVLPSGKVAVTSGMGVRVTDLETDNKYFPQNGNDLEIMPNGKFVVADGNLGGRFKLYSEKALISTGWNQSGGIIAIQSDGKIIAAKNFAVGNAKLTRIQLLGSQGTRIATFDNDSTTDFAVFRQSENKTSIHYRYGGLIERTSTNPTTKVFPEFTSIIYGINNVSREVLTTWEAGETSNEQAYFNFERFSNDNFIRNPWGLNGDIPFGGDFDGNGTFDVGVFRPSNGVWYGYQGETLKWGAIGDKPVPADYDYDGITDYAVYRPSTGVWWILKSSGGSSAIRFGLEEDIPLTGDYDGDGFADFTVYRPSEGIWYQLLTTEGFRGLRFGVETDYPVPGDYDGDGKHDIAVYRDGTWYLLQSENGLEILQFGSATDKPISVRYDE